MVEITLVVAFMAGVVSFLSPCVLPLVPGFLSYLAGVTLADARVKRFNIFLNALLFVVGFSFVFAVLGILLNTILESFAYTAEQWLARIGGGIIIFFGLYLTGLIKIPYLEQKHTIRINKKFSSRYITSFVFGSAFAAGWTPCVGAALGAILGLAAREPGIAFQLLLAYSLGLGVPFLIVGFFAAQAGRVIERYSHTVTYINIFFGILLVLLGILIFTGNLNRIANFSLLQSIVIEN